MRLHRLTVSAFGPFAGTEQVDFDGLNDAGLFLLTGATGAGKSSLLDAVCFALYGTVPGARGTKALKSQHAPIDAPPEVVLDFTVRDRRFTVRRTPEWTRPKKRGDGVLNEKASASITETTGGVEHFLSSRAAEVGVLVTDLMGMSASQFVQVALLPQGEFQTFLRASSQERHDVLQQLFRTNRFARIEDWVHDHSRQLKDHARAGHSAVQRILDTVADRSGVPTPDDLTGDALAAAAAQGRALAWVDAVLTDAQTDAATAATAHREACAAQDSARGLHQAAVRRHEMRLRQESARRTLDEIERTEADAELGRHALDADERARRCRPLLLLVDQAILAREAARTARDGALRDLVSAAAAPAVAVQLPTGPNSEALAALGEEVRGRIARLDALVPREELAVATRTALASARTRLTAAQRELAEAITRADELPGQVRVLTEQHSDATRRAARREAITLSLAAARERHAAAVELEQVTELLVTLEQRHRDDRDRAQDARDRVQELLARRLAGMAAELAGSLADGAACQVCGSTEHPRPAEAAVDAVTEADQEHAERAYAECTARRDRSARELQEAGHRRDGLVVATGGISAAEGAAQVAELDEELADALNAATERDALEQRLETLRAEQGALADRRSEVTAEVAALAEVVSGHEATVAALDAEIAAAVGTPGGSLRDAVAGLARFAQSLGEAHAASAALDVAEARLADTDDQAHATAAEHAFSTLGDARDALLPPHERERLASRLRDRTAARLQAEAVLDDPEQALLDLDEPEGLVELAARVTLTDTAAAAAARDLHLSEERVAAVATQRARLLTALEDWSPVRDESLRAESMARLVRGTGQDNQLQMRLSAYVLATRLDQVVAAANERLGHMRDQRYLLQRAARAARKGAQAGLGLEIVDQWTGDVRDPATLSGGETFVVSLSLALGLADVVTQEAGGTEVETLFVDEGFGTLDADTLDDVMDRLDGLRAGGRTVGVVSHVSELRNRIPTQVHVHKGRSGSSVAVSTLVG